MKTAPQDNSNGYDELAESFIRARNPRIGMATVREWSRTLAPGCSVLDLGCGHGVPISQALIEEGFVVYGIDASPRMIAAFRERFPNVQTECSAVEDSEFFRRRFEAVVAWGLIFLLPTGVQTAIIRKVAGALVPGGKFLFTSPRKAVTWKDAMTGRESTSLGLEAYDQILRAAGLTLIGEQFDEGDNYYYLVAKP